MKKLLKPLGRITLIILISWVIYGIVKLLQGEGDVIDVIGPICIIIFFYFNVFIYIIYNKTFKKECNITFSIIFSLWKN